MADQNTSIPTHGPQNGTTGRDPNLGAQHTWAQMEAAVALSVIHQHYFGKCLVKDKPS